MAEPFRPRPEQLALVPEISGNAINGLGETAPRRPTPVYWRPADLIAHGALQQWYYTQNASPEAIAARDKTLAAVAQPLGPIAETREDGSPEEWAARIKAAALDGESDRVAITRFRSEWVFDDSEAPYPFIVMIAVAMDYGALAEAPSIATSVEVMTQYGRGTRAAHAVADWIRARGYDALPHCGPSAGPVLLIPPAIEAGLGELGKHGSLIHREYGSCFRLAGVLTDMPLVPDAPAPFGADDFCLNCQACTRACPAGAIQPDRQTVRGTAKWYVDFDKCVLFFNENKSCAICLAVCPWSRPGVAPSLAEKMARRQRA